MAGTTYTPLQNGERSPYGGGGGKMRFKRAPKRNGTPYDRPAAGRHASAGPQAAALMNSTTNGDVTKRDGWLGSRLLGTASKIVTTGASYLYSSFFKRPAGGGMLLLNDVEKPAVDHIEGVTDTLSPSAAEAESREVGSQHDEEDQTLEVESWMKRTFPREEAEKLIASLRSYVKEAGTAEEQIDHANSEGQRRTTLVNTVLALESTPSNGQLSDAQRWREERTKARQEQKSNFWPGESGKENGTFTGAGTSEAGEVVAVDVARAYMGERVTRVVTPARVTLTREKVPTPLRLSPYQPSPYLLRRQQVTSISTQFEPANIAPGGVRNRDGVSDEGLRTPPFSRTVGRLLPVARTNAPSPAIGYPHSGEGSKKRGSAALEDGVYSSGGPIRRLRPRSSLYTPSPAGGLQRRGGLGMYPPPPRILQTPTDVKQKSITTWNRNVDTEMEETRGLAVGTNGSVPERASATARKILETLDMMTPSPKEKSLDTELTLVRERSPTELTTSMINDKARQTMGSWDFPGPQDSEEAGPSGRGRNLENDLSSAAGFSWKGAEQGTKSRSKGKSPASTPSHTFEEKTRDQPLFSFQDTVRSKVSESSLATVSPAIGTNQGFQINADVDDSDEESRGANANLLTTVVTSTTSFLTTKSSNSGARMFDNNPSRPLNIATPLFAAPIAVESQTTVSEVIDGKLTTASGGFTFPSSNSFGTSLEPPPTPKPFPAPSHTGPSAKPNGLPTYKFNAGPLGDNMFKLPVAPVSDGGFDNAHTAEMKTNHHFESKSDYNPSDVSATETFKPISTKPAEATKGEVSSTPNLSGSEISNLPSAATTFTSSTFSLSNFGAPGAGAKPGVFNSSSQITSPIPGSSSAQLTTSVSKTETSLFNFGKPPSLEPATVFPTSPVAFPSVFGSSTITSSGATTASPSPAFGSSSSLGMTKAPFAFGSSASSSPVAPVLLTGPTDDSSRPQKRMFGVEQTKTGDATVAPSAVSFGLSAAATTSTSASSGASTFTTTGFGQGTSSSAPASNTTSLFGLKPASADSTPESLSTPSSSPATSTFSTTPNAFGSTSPIFGSSTFGSSNAAPSFGGASTAFGASSTPAFGTSSTPAFGASNTAAFGASSTPAFGASSTPAFGASNTPAFGASSTPAFGSSTQSSQSPSGFSGFGAPANTGSVSSPTTFSFGAAAGSSPFSFGGSTEASPITSTGAFAFGASSAASPASPFNFGAKPASPPVFGMGSSAPAFGSSPNGGMGNDMEDTMADDGQMMASSPPPQQQTPLFGASQTPGSGTFQFGNPATPSPGVFGGFGAAATPPANPFAASPQQPTPVANPFAASPQQSTPVANPFAASPQPGQPLNFGGGGFAVGATGQDASGKPTRKFIKAKRAGSVKRK